MRALTLLLVLVLAPAALARPARAPKAGEYRGKTDGRPGMLLLIDGTSATLASFAFRCDGQRATVGIQSIPIEKRRRRYRFKIAARGSISFAGEYALSENGAVRIRGTFSRSARRATGTLIVRSSRCKTGILEWVARRHRGE